MLWLMLLTLPCLGASVPMNPALRPEEELVGIIGGRNATPGQWPWQVSLWKTNGQSWYFTCGGSIIHEQWVLTAAHCVSGLAPQHLKIQVGEIKRFPRGPFKNVIEVIPHPNYKLRPKIQRDVALLKLENPLTLSYYVNKIHLPAPDLKIPAGKYCWVTGWGNIKVNERLPPSYNLQEVRIPILDEKFCKNKHGKYMEEDMLCAGSVGRDSCYGDSGGPLVCYWQHTWLQIGIVSWGINCGTLLYPGVYTKVSYYREWIHSHVPLSL